MKIAGTSEYHAIFSSLGVEDFCFKIRLTTSAVTSSRWETTMLRWWSPFLARILRRQRSIAVRDNKRYLTTRKYKIHGKDGVALNWWLLSRLVLLSS